MTNSLSVDERIRRVGISLASKCECCPQGDFEDLDHVLYSGKIAAKLWQICSSFLGIPYVATRSWLVTVEAWFRRTKKSSKVGNLIGLIPCIIIWNLWIWRCSAHMEGQKVCFNVLWRKVKYWIHWVGLRLRDTGILHHRDQAILKELNLPAVSFSKTNFVAVSWEKLELGWFKLNTNGSSLVNPGESGAGGLIRDHKGNLIVAFSEYFGIDSNNKAKLLGVLIGLRKCKAMGLRNIVVELDSSLIVTWFEKGSCRVWYLEDFWEEIFLLISGLNIRFNHVFREGNQAADWLSKRGSAGIMYEYNSNNIPKELKGILQVDNCGLPCLRMK
jgi:ribonuclease HI